MQRCECVLLFLVLMLNGFGDEGAHKATSGWLEFTDSGKRLLAMVLGPRSCPLPLVCSRWPAQRVGKEVAQAFLRCNARGLLIRQFTLSGQSRVMDLFPGTQTTHFLGVR